MSKIHKIIGYVIDWNDDFEDWQDWVLCAIDNNKYGGTFVNINSVTSKEFEADDDMDINQNNCSLDAFNKYFE